ncbi:MAG TPA: PIN domain-containing protein [Myxococcota bacterium]|nr:PIN domain-containing protein [Myxococcota bacterium]
MIDRIFLDTNVLVHAFDDSNPEKKNRSLEILAQVGDKWQAVISTQVLQEFYVVVLRKLKRPLSENDAEGAIRRFAKLPIVLIDSPMIISAIKTSRENRMSLWDALIVQSALESNCRKLLTEDLQHGRQIASLQIENPFLSRE